MSSRKERQVYGLTEEEAAALQSDGDDFYGIEDSGTEQEARETSVNVSED